MATNADHVPSMYDIETGRLDTLDALSVIGVEPQPEFNALTELAAHLFNAQIAVISIVGDEKMWTLSSVGLNLGERQREGAFCSKVIDAGDSVTILDTAKHPEFKNSPQVVGGPKVRFYAGAPITTATGTHIGAFCVMNDQPREDFSDEDMKALASLGDWVMAKVLLRRLKLAMKDVSEERSGANLEARMRSLRTS